MVQTDENLHTEDTNAGFNANAPLKKAPTKRRLLLMIACGLIGSLFLFTGCVLALRPSVDATPDDAAGALDTTHPNASIIEPISGVLDMAVTSWVSISVNGKVVVSLPTEEDAQQLLDDLLAAGTVSNGKSSFVDEVQVVSYAEGSSVLGREEARIVLETESPLKVQCIVTKTEEESIPFETVKKNSDTLDEGSTKTQTKGKNGLKRKTITITYVDGKQTDRQESPMKTVKKPVNQVILVGTKKESTTSKPEGVQGTPSFGWPVSGSITSSFGKRNGKLHAGIDIGKPVGTTVKASAAGTVTRAGSAGTYGILVEINHGNGWVTRYAHNSKVLVKAGDKVTKGQSIALSGNTGRSTGPHVHFEIRHNGTAVNPLKYLP